MSRPARRRLDYAASLTAQFNAAQRAAESTRPAARRLLDDPYAKYFAGHYRSVLTVKPVARSTLWLLDHWLCGLHAHIVLRARYADEVLRDAVSDGVMQVVLLGAGFDTTAFRTAPCPNLTIFEVDAPSTQHAKRRVIAHAGLTTDNQIRWGSCDFERDTLTDSLFQEGFDGSRRCVVVWLGVSFYLAPTAFDRTLTELAALSAPGSLLVFDYGDPELVTGDHPLAGARRTSRLVRRRGEPYRSGFTEQDLTSTFQAHGYVVRDHARVPSLMKRYAPEPDRPPYRVDDWCGVVTAERLHDG